jgi:hypothetical protein
MRKALGLSKPLALGFAREFLPKEFDEVRYILSAPTSSFEPC